MSGFYGVNLRLRAAFQHLMVPLVRILVRNGIPLRDLFEAVKGIYVRLAAEECASPERPASLARVAIVTGLNRREVERILTEEDELQRALHSNASAIARVLQGWHNDPEFIGPYGFPRELQFSRDLDGATTFLDLVERYAPEVDPSSMLEQLLRFRMATQSADSGVVSAEKRTFIPGEMAPEQIEIFARGVRRYVETINHNLSQQDPSRRRFERWVFPDYGLRVQEWDMFRELVNDRLKGVVEDLDRRFSEFPRPDPSKDEVLRVGVGMYVYQEESDDSELFDVKKFGVPRLAQGIGKR